MLPLRLRLEPTLLPAGEEGEQRERPTGGEDELNREAATPIGIICK
jgi:hypothetical protein